MSPLTSSDGMSIPSPSPRHSDNILFNHPTVHTLRPTHAHSLSQFLTLILSHLFPLFYLSLSFLSSLPISLSSPFYFSIFVSPSAAAHAKPSHRFSAQVTISNYNYLSLYPLSLPLFFLSLYFLSLLYLFISFLHSLYISS